MLKSKIEKSSSPKQQAFFTHNLRYFSLVRLFGSLYFLVPVWVAFELRYLTFSQITSLEMIIAGSQLVLELPTGALADLWGRKNSIAIGYLLSFVGHIVFAYSSTFPQFMIAACLFGLSSSLISGSEDALIFDTLKQAGRTDYFSKLVNNMQILFNWGIAGATLVGGLVYGHFFRLPVILNGLAHLLAAIYIYRMIEPKIDSEQFTFKNYLKQTKEGFKELFKDQRSRDFSWFYILVGSLSWPMVIAAKNFALVEIGFTEGQQGIMLPIMSLLVVYFLHFLIAKDLFKQLKFTFLSLTIFTIIGYFLSALLSPYIMPLAIMMLQFVSSARWNILGKLTNDLYSSKNRATAISTLNMIISIAYVLVMGLLTVLGWQFDNALQILFIVLGALALFGLLPIALKLSKDYEQTESHAILS